MNEHRNIDPKTLIQEITRYLAAIDLFRAERCEPTWLPETAPRPIVPMPEAAIFRPARSAR